MPRQHKDTKQQKELKRQICISALGAGAVLGLPQLFVQPVNTTSNKTGPAQSSSSFQAARYSEAQQKTPADTSTPPLTVLGFGLVGAAALAANLRSGRSSKAQTSRHFFGSSGSGSSYASFDPANEAGVQDPVGFWDPLGLSDDKDEATFKRRRAVEIKHGRICMYATIGYMVPEYFKFPGYLSPSMDIKFEDVPNGLGALSKVPLAGWLQIFAFAGVIETTGFFSGSSTPIGFMSDSTQEGAPGDYGIGFPNFIGKVDDPEAKQSKLAAELANGRLAMVAIIGMFFQDGLTGSAWGDWSLYTASPLRAFESELGVQAPVGFWDPVGFSKDGDEASFKRRRSVEIKHGRICMLATMGYITPEITGKFPGYLSPSAELKFEDIPNGLAAISKVPGAGWAQIVAYFGYCEFSGGFDDYKTGTPGDYGWKVLTSSDPDEKTKKLAAEIANGRLAMVAIIGMFFQDGLTGSAWGDWSLYTDSPLRARPSRTARQFFGDGGGSTSSYAAFDPATEAGVQDPVGFWDPLGFSDDKDEATFKRRRAVEIKHGRICMYATIGYMVPEYFKFPGYLSPSEGIKFEDVPNGLGALSKVPLAGWLQIFAFAGVIETTGFFSGSSTSIGFMQDSTQDGAPGDYGIGFPNFIGTVDDPEAKKSKLAAELANGRLAMVAIIGMFFQDGLTGSAWGDWASYTDSPLRAFESELGVQAPVGFWDPVGFTKDGDEASFKRRRSVEIKHGRICMLATMGYITPEITGKFPGYLSPSAELKFEDIPNGLAAISKVPGAGWAQIVAYFGYCEFSGGFDDYKTGTPGDYGWKVLTASDPEEKTKKLSAEIANGRLAMVAIIGMFFQDGLTGSAWGDWTLYTDSPLRFYGGGGGSSYAAFDPATEAGVQDPVGFWDPLGFADDKDEAAFKRRRAVEIKHGRICMYATIGYMVPEYFKFPGYLSPSEGIKFEDVPNGLGALSKVPLAGWLQIFAFAGVIETTGFFSGSSTAIGFMKDSTMDGAPGDYGIGFPNFIGTVEDPEAKKSKLAAELANGRLAMVAIIGMFFQDGLTGSAWGDWANYTDSPLRAGRIC